MRETPRAAVAFEEYAAMGPSRSLRKLAEKQGQSEGKAGANLTTLEGWSSAHNWQERVKAYDAERVEEKRIKRDAEIDKMNEEHALLGRTQALRAVKQIEELMKAQRFGSQATVQLFKVSTDLERIARGAATDRQELTGKDGSPLETGQSVVVYIPDNGRDTPKQEGGDA